MGAAHPSPNSRLNKPKVLGETEVPLSCVNMRVPSSLTSTDAAISRCVLGDGSSRAIPNVRSLII